MDFGTWNPLHSAAVKEILAHARPAERRRFMLLSGVAGLILALETFLVAMPAFAMAYYTGLQPFTGVQWTLVAAGMLMGCGIVVVTILAVRRAVRNMLVGFEWARDQGITTEALKLNRWP